MTRFRTAEQALTIVTQPSRQQYVCRACRANAIRQLHTTRILAADLGIFKRVRETLFGSAKSKEEDKKRAEKTQERAKLDSTRSELEVLIDGNKKYEVAAIVDSSSNPEYTEATNWDGLPRVGGKKWVKEKLDQGEPYVGLVHTSLQKQPRHY